MKYFTRKIKYLTKLGGHFPPDEETRLLVYADVEEIKSNCFQVSEATRGTGILPRDQHVENGIGLTYYAYYVYVVGLSITVSLP